MINIINDDCFNYIESMQDNCIDSIITDPPYRILKNHKIERKIDMSLFFQECFRILKQNGFLIFTGIQPSLSDWIIKSKEQGFKFLQEIIWDKIHCSSFMNPIRKQHENIIILSKGGKHHQLKTIRIPREQEEVSSIQMKTINHNYSTIRKILNDKEKLKEWLDILENNLQYNDKRSERAINDEIHKFADKQMKYEKLTQRDIYDLQAMQKGSKLSSIIKMSTHNRQKYGIDQNEYNIKHPTVKPINLIKILIELTSNENDLIFDPFLGSGTTAIACKKLKRNFIGCEIDKEYYEICCKRIFEEKQLELI